MKETLTELNRCILIVFGVIFGCLALALILYLLFALFTSNTPEKRGSACHPPVGDFSEASLVGTWVAGAPDHSEKLIIKADGTYKQIIHAEPPNYQSLDYEGDWKPWHLEYSSDNPPYLHLTGFAFCGATSIPCGSIDGGGYDFCRDESLPMKGEGILFVIEGHLDNPDPQGPKYIYALYYPMGSENVYSYSLQTP